MRGVVGTKGRVARIGVLIGVAAAATVGLAGFAGPAAPADPPPPAPVGYTISVGSSGPPDLTCQVARVDLGTGALTPIGSPQSLCPNDLVPGPDGRYYGVALSFDVDVPSQLVAIDVATGAITPIGSTGFHAVDGGGVAFTSDGALLFEGLVLDTADLSSSSRLYRLDTATGAGTLLGQVANDQVEVSGLTRACDGRLLAASFEGVVSPTATGLEPGPLLARGADTGAAGSGAAASGATPPDAGATAVPTGTLSVVDPATGALTPIGPMGDTRVASGIDVGADGRLWGVGVTTLLFPDRTWISMAIDQATGASTQTATLPVTNPGIVLGLSISPACVPVVAPRFTG